MARYNDAAYDVEIVLQRTGINLGPGSGWACATHARSVKRRPMFYKPEFSHHAPIPAKSPAETFFPEVREKNLANSGGLL